jgi:hypothetical protein
MALTPTEHEQSVSNQQTHSASGLVDVLIKIGRKRARILEAMRRALLDGDDAEALERARELTGLPRKRLGGSIKEQNDE